MQAIDTVIITGCTGEIGNALVRLLLERGSTVFALCRPGSHRLRYLPESDRLHILEVDVFRLCEVADQIDQPCDAFFHFAWQGSYGDGRNDPYAQTLNISASLDAVKLASKLGCKVFVGAGSQAQYGDTDETLTEMTPMRPKTYYGVAKLCAETMTRQLCSQMGIRHVWARVCSVYGPCDGPHTLITYLMRMLLQGEEAILTHCAQTWDFLFAEDAANAFLALAEKGIDGCAYCLANGKSRALREYIEEFQEATAGNARVRIGGKAYGTGQRMHFCADISKLTRDTNFIPLVSFREGIARTYEWYAAHPEFFKERGLA